MSKTKILLVDDVEFSLQIQKETLDRSDSEITTAMSGPEALEAIKKSKPDIILMDLYMPGMTGDECCKIIKNDPEFSDIPVIMVTSASEEEAREKCADAKCEGYIRKPFKGRDLYKKIKEHIDLSVRKHIRVSYDGDITYSYDGKTYEGRIQNLSATGLFIPTETLPSEGIIMELEFPLPGMEGNILASAQVMRLQNKSLHIDTDADKGFGVRFTRLSDEHKQAIVDLTYAR